VSIKYSYNDIRVSRLTYRNIVVYVRTEHRNHWFLWKLEGTLNKTVSFEYRQIFSF